MRSGTKQERILYFDILRVSACFFVIVLHLAAYQFDQTEVGSRDWMIFNVFDSLSRWAVPIFVMISGALFLAPGKRTEPRVLFGKNLLRIGTAFVFWSALYAFIYVLQGKRLRDAVEGFVTGHIHLWFLYMIAGLYLLVPLLRRLVSSEKLTLYFLFLWVVFSVLYPTAQNCISYFGLKYADWMTTVLEKIGGNIAFGYAGYFVLGHLLHQKELSGKLRLFLYGLGIGGAAATVLLTLVYSRRMGYVFDRFYSAFSANVVFMAVAVFVFVRYRTGPLKDGFAQKLLLLASECSFGIYLVHYLVMEQLKILFGLHVLSFHPALSVPALSGIVFVVSFAISFVLRQIPLVKKYLV